MNYRSTAYENFSIFRQRTYEILNVLPLHCFPHMLVNAILLNIDFID